MIRYLLHGTDTASAESDARAARLIAIGYVECTQAQHRWVWAKRDNARRLAMKDEDVQRMTYAERVKAKV
jgi:hypothetical protein